MPDLRRGPVTEMKRLANRLRRRGIWEVVQLASHRMRESMSSSDEIVLHARAASSTPHSVDGLSGRLASADDAAAYARDIGTDSVATFSSRLAPDVACYVVEGDSKLLHASWITTSAAWTREIRGYLAPPEGDAYVYESFTRADARGRGIYPLALAGLLTVAAEWDCGRLWVAVERSNVPSARAIAKAGFTEAFTISYGRCAGFFKLEPLSGLALAEGRDFLRYGRRFPASGA